jgi:hypothetical protein
LLIRIGQILSCRALRVVPLWDAATRSYVSRRPTERKVTKIKLRSVAVRKGQRKNFDCGLTRVVAVLLPSGHAKRQARSYFSDSKCLPASQTPIPRCRRQGSGRRIRSSWFFPEFRQRTADPVDRILSRQCDLRNGFEGARTVFDSRALVVGTGRRVGADDEEVVGRG